MKIFLLRPLVLISIILGCLFLSSCTNTAQPTSTNISLDWSLTKNAIEPSVNSEATFTIYNNGNNTIEKGWEIYFSTIYLPDDVKTQTDGFKIEHLSGDFFKMYASNNDKEIAVGESLSISYSSKRYLLKNSHVPKAPFIVLAGTNNGIPITDYSKSHIELKDHVEAYEPSDSPITFPTAENLLRESNNLSLLSSENINPIIPTPVTLIKGNGYFNLSDEILIYSDPEFEKEKDWLERYLPSVFSGSISTSSNGKDALISLIYDENISGQDAYSLIIGHSNIVIKSSTTSGAFYGLQSIIALLPLNAFEKTQTTLTFPKVEIKDQARFPHRGLFLDIARNFQQKKDILKLIDVMAFYKLNVLQLHLANDEGWRIDIPGLPELVEVGSKRGFAKHEEGIVWPYYGSGPKAENSLYGSGYLSKSDFIEILQYAHTRHVQVIPEIVAPAHMKAAIISMNKRYENYKAKGDLAKAEEYLLVHPDDTSTYTSVQRYKNNTMDVCMESSFTFYEKVLDEILLMYKEAEVPISTFHVGGDEVPRGVWEGSPACAELIAQNNEIGSTADLHNYYYTRLSDLLAQKDLNLAGWEEVGQTIAEKNGRSTHIPNQELLGKNIRLHAWNAVVGWGGTDMAYKLANAGYEVVLSNSSNLYFDLAYDRDPNEPGLHWSGFVNLKSAWQMTPFNNVISNDYDIYGNKVDVEKFASTQVQLTEAGKKRIIGLQGQLWSETINGPNMMFYSLLPKMLGLAERAWAVDPNWSTIIDSDKRNKTMIGDWNEFANTVGQIELPRLDYLFGGYSTRLPKPGAILVDNTLKANVESPGLIIHYTLDGNEPTINDPIYSEPVKIENPSTTKVILLKSFTPSGKSSSGITELIVKN
jgi:hexosaminidase